MHDRLIGLWLATLLVTACGQTPPPAVSGFDLEAQAAAVERDRQALEAARRELAAAAAVQPAGAPAPRLLAARTEFDRAFAAFQQRLAAFLNVALNEYPESEATRRVLTAYADEAVGWAQEVERRGGDTAAARRLLRQLVTHFEAIDAPLPPALAAAAGP